MRSLLVSVMLVVSSNSFAQVSLAVMQRCYAQFNSACVLTLHDDDGSIDSIYLNVADGITPSSEMVKEYADIGITLQALNPVSFKNIASMSADTKTVYNLESELTTLLNIPDEQWSAYAEGILCAGTAVGCGYGIYSTFVTGGGALFIARINCGMTLVSCVSAVRSWNKWQNYQTRKRNEEKIKAAGNPPAPGGSSSTGATGGDIGPGPMVGGGGGSSKPVKGTIEVYDPETGTWQ